MKPLCRGLVVGVLQCAIVLSMTAKYEWDRERLPRVWARVAPVDPNAPLRGRYLQMRLEVVMDSPVEAYPTHVRLAIKNAQLTAKLDEKGALEAWAPRNGVIALAQPVAFFLSDTADDPSRLKPGEELWVEVSVPPNSLPRPIRLGIKKDGVLTPLNLQ
jgi:uncharacterized membrane-anchored protein